MKRALVIGIDDYTHAPLKGCVHDAISMANVLGKNGDGSPNFTVRLITSADQQVTSELLIDEISSLFTGDAETVLFYFAGHGLIHYSADAGYLVSQDGRKGAWGVSLAELINFANKAYSKIQSTVIILDSCHSGFVGDVPGLDNRQAAAIGHGVTILTACHRDGVASEEDGRGVFTSILLDGLTGGSADVCGRITPASLYSHVDQALGAWEQRPIYKANVQKFVVLRQVTPKIPLEVLRRLPEYFPEAAYVYPLDPSFEPDRINVPQEFQNIPVNKKHALIFKELQMCNRHGLVIPTDSEHMYYAAIQSKGCKLTALGAHYRNLSAMGRL